MTDEIPSGSFEHPVSAPGKIAGPAIRALLEKMKEMPHDQFEEETRIIEASVDGPIGRRNPMPPLDFESGPVGLGDLELYVLEDGTEARVDPAPTPNHSNY